MKHIKLLMLLAIAVVLFNSCDRDLPYPIDEVKKGVVVDIVRVSGTNGVISEGTFDGNYKVKLQIPTQQGDYSNLDYIQLVVVYTPTGASIPSKSVVLVDNITNLDNVFTLNLADVYQKIGLSTKPALGESLQFTTNVVLKNGQIVYGWTKYSLDGREQQIWNNNAFTGWQVDGRGYSYKVDYDVSCSFDIEDFVGPATMTDGSPFYEGGQYEVNLVKISDTQLQILDFFEIPYAAGTSIPQPVVVNINTEDYSITMPKAILMATYGSYTNLAVSGSGKLNVCNRSFYVTGPTNVDQGSFGSGTWSVQLK